jgi:hypothetical protein
LAMSRSPTARSSADGSLLERLTGRVITVSESISSGALCFSGKTPRRTKCRSSTTTEGNHAAHPSRTHSSWRNSSRGIFDPSRSDSSGTR